MTHYEVVRPSEKETVRKIKAELKHFTHPAAQQRGAREDEEALRGYWALVDRPALFVDDGLFEAPRGRWRILEMYRTQIEDVIRSVGCIERSSGSRTRPPLGTGFSVGPGVVMTNRHVVERFATQLGDDWVIDEGATITIDFTNDGTTRSDARRNRVIAVAHVSTSDDLALLAIAAIAGVDGTLPPPLPIAGPSARPRAGTTVYAVGYPTRDPGSHDVAFADIVFRGRYDVKRVQPGKIMKAPSRTFAHDCSTLAGNSGSCIVDLRRGEIIGLHCDGARAGNVALSLWPIRSFLSDLIVRAGG